MACKYCGKKVVLVPSAKERAKGDVTGKTTQHYIDLFPNHAECWLKIRNSK